MIYEKDLQQAASLLPASGVLEKWVHGGWYIKASSGGDAPGVESDIECIASDLALLLGVHRVPYFKDTLVGLDGSVRPVCVSPDYNQEPHIVGSLSADAMLLRLGVTKRSERYGTLSGAYPGVRMGLDRMIVLDYLIDNYDRHLRNFEFIYTDRGTVELAPLFDHGSSMLANWSDSDLEDLYTDDILADEVFEEGDTPCKGFAADHRMALRLVDPGNVAGLSWGLTAGDIDEVVLRHAIGWSDLRVWAVTKLLTSRLARLGKRFGG